MDFTGERYIPSIAGQIKYEHLHRYALAVSFARDRSVLDIACGEGYGAAMLAQVAKSAVGVDIDPVTIKHARQSYYYQNLKFLQGSCAAIPLPDKSIEVVTSFETLEHHDQHEEMMLEIRRVLKPDGVLIISSPNRFTYSDEANFVNEYHVKELYYDELLELLGRHFQHIRCYGQRLATASFVSPLKTDNVDHFRAFSGDPEQIKETVCPLPSPIYFIAVCSDSELSEVPLESVYLDSKDDLLKSLEAERMTHIHQLEFQVKHLNDTISTERAASHDRGVNAEAELERRSLELAKYEELQRRGNKELERIRGELSSHEVRRAYQNEKDKEREALHAQERLVLSEQAKKLSTELMAAQHRLTNYEDQLSQQTKGLDEIRAQLLERKSELATLREELVQRNGQLRSQLAQSLELSQSITDAHSAQAQLQFRLTQIEAELSAAKSEVVANANRSDEAYADLNEAKAELRQRSEVLDWTHTSKAWRLVGLIRRSERFTHELRRRLKPGSAKVFTGKIDSAGPFDSRSTRIEIVGWAFSKAAPVSRVEVFLNDMFLGSLAYGIPRPDLAEPGSDDFPPNWGYAGSFTLTRSPGRPELLTVRAFDSRGNKQLFLRWIEPYEGNLALARSEEDNDGQTDPLLIKTAAEPLISIIIPVFNQASYTLNCLRSVKNELDHSGVNAEVLVVDDASTDSTQEMLSRVQGIRVIRNEKNSGFIDSCNRGAEQAAGEFLLFLNNDTTVQQGCLEELIGTFTLNPSAGLVGAKLLYPDGRLQEAGGIIWNDASGWNYGRFDDPEKPEYCYLREVDYCSGAGIVVPKSLFQKLNGFDTHYRPAYCEDSDLAFRIREAGFKVYYQPFAKIVHFEGATSGRDTSTNVKSYQVKNQQKLRARWSEVLARHGESGVDPYTARERNVHKRILVVDACVLTPDQDAGSLTVFNHIKVFQALGYKVTFAPDNLHRDEKYTTDLQRLGIECLYWPYITSLKAHLEAFGSYYDIVFIARADVAEKHIDNVRTYCRRAKIIFDTEDLHFVREQRRAELENNPALRRAAAQRKKQELSVAARADCTLVVSSYEKEVLRAERPSLNVSVVPIPRDMPGHQTNFSERKDLLFIGGFQHPPNLDAVLYFVQTIFPLIKLEIPEMKFFIVGSKPPTEILSLAREPDIVVTGYVPDIAPYFHRCRLSIAPLRYGAGIKGKVITSLSYGLPVVATGIACEGLGLRDEVDALIANDPADFARKVVRLHRDVKLWNELSLAGFEKVKRDYSIAATKEFFECLFDDLTRLKIKSAENNEGAERTFAASSL